MILPVLGGEVDLALVVLQPDKREVPASGGETMQD